MQKPIAQRTYEWVDGRGHVEVAIFQPERDEKTGNFDCRYEIIGLDGLEPVRGELRGIDPLQAIQQAMQGLSVALEPYRGRLRWFGDPWLGLPRYVPGGFKPEINVRFERLLEREVVKLLKTLAADQHSRPRETAGRKQPRKKTPKRK
ncbi:MAG TPA: hypothetical protein VEY88_06305 [Archangium sp.]|nr:hypothetical protein [Archangium sp.]